MVYQGSKARLAKDIISILQCLIDTQRITTYIEPFVGGANIIDKIVCPRRVGSDINDWLIAMWQNVNSVINEVPQEYLTREHYNRCRQYYRDNNFTVYSKSYIALIGFLGSMNGRFYDGGYGAIDKKTNRNYYKQRLNNLKTQILNTSNFDKIEFYSFDFLDYRRVANALIYCDPPYAGTKPYNNRLFCTEKYWDIVRLYSKDNYVICSELSAPEDFIEVKQFKLRHCLGVFNNYKRIEKLFIYKDGLLTFDMIWY